MRCWAWMGVSVVIGLGCQGAPRASLEAPKAPRSPQTSVASKPADALKAGLEHLRRSRYSAAEEALLEAVRGPQRADAQLALAELFLLTGRYPDAIGAAERARAWGTPAEKASLVAAAAERRLGQLERAEGRLRELEAEPSARRARLMLGEILIERGQRRAAEAPLMTLIEDYRANRIGEQDGQQLAWVGRAAHLLRSPRDANQAFNQAELATTAGMELLLWRAELFLEKHDPGHAEEVVREALALAPNHPEALVWMAQIKLAQTYDFDAAERLAQRALGINPRLGSARFVLAGIALRDFELERADAEIQKGLAQDPGDLDLLSLRATVRFLADDLPGFEAAKRIALDRNPESTRTFEVVGEYAEWEHRYDEIVRLMREALLVDGKSAAARAALGINLIRSGDDVSGVGQLELAFEQDPYNVRVYNTLNLYREVIPAEYETARAGRFWFRYPKRGRAVLEHYVPALLERAWREMERRYQFVPRTPVGIELYPDPEHFAVRTSGLPNVGIQGDCFGHSLASIAPGKQRFNIGMTLWHELSHVFHIQQSKSHVPRWFTEGLAELETLRTRPEWRREHDRELYEAVRRDSLPHLQEMNRAFTHAEDMGDMATAYYASSRILTMIDQHYGAERIAQMLTLWGEGLRTGEVIQRALGVSEAGLDAEFRTYLSQDLARYARQFVPLQKARAAPAESGQHPKKQDPLSACEAALTALNNGDLKAAERAVAAALRLKPGFPDAVFLSGRIAIIKKDITGAQKAVDELLHTGNDGYDTQMLRAAVAERGNNLGAEKVALEAAHSFDPSSAEALTQLAALHREAGDKAGELTTLRKLARLEEHNPAIYQRLVRLLIDAQQFAEAATVGEAAVYVDMNGLLTHQLYAEALVAARRAGEARVELEVALACPGSAEELADAHAQLAEVLTVLKDAAGASREKERARQLDPKNIRLQRLGR